MVGVQSIASPGRSHATTIAIRPESREVAQTRCLARREGYLLLLRCVWRPFDGGWWRIHDPSNAISSHPAVRSYIRERIGRKNSIQTIQSDRMSEDQRQLKRRRSSYGACLYCGDLEAANTGTPVFALGGPVTVGLPAKGPASDLHSNTLHAQAEARTTAARMAAAVARMPAPAPRMQATMTQGTMSPTHTGWM